MKTTHTPGPWQVRPRINSNSFRVYVKDKDVEICQISHWGKRQADLTADLKPDGEPEANARLIASAPELLEALQSLVPEDPENHKDTCDAMNYKRGFRESEGTCTCGYRKARAAIAKATKP